MADTALRSSDPLLSPSTSDQRYPVFFPSVSSLKTGLRPLEYVRVLRTLRYHRFLISAYDLANATKEERVHLLRLLFEARGAGAWVLLDSGNYESFWAKDTAWNQERYCRELHEEAWDVAFSFDRQSVSDDVAGAVKAVTDGFVRDSDATPGKVIPIIHGSRKNLPVLCGSVADILGVPAIAVPERELGFDIVERFDTIRRIRVALEGAGSVRIHLLGTGNPTSMLLYALAGADSFDGLEWCQTVVDHNTGHLHHFSHYPLFQHQTSLGATELPLVLRALAHNLSFFAKWEEDLKTARGNGTLSQLAKERAPSALGIVDGA